jgi:type VI secretion system protein ImpA
MPSDVAKTFNTEQLLVPVSDSNRVGVDLRTLIDDNSKRPLLDEIEQKRRDILGGKDEQLDPSREWRQIERTLTRAFEKGKELSAAVILVQAAVINRSWPALAPAVRLIRELQERFWEDLHPVSEKDDSGNLDFGRRLSNLERLDHENYMPLAIGSLTLTDPHAGGSFSLVDYQRLQILKERPLGKSQDPKARQKMIEEKVAAFEKAVLGSSAGWYQALLTQAEDGLAELAKLCEFVDRRYAVSAPADRPTFRGTASALEHCVALAKQFFKRVGGEEAPAAHLEGVREVEGVRDAGNARNVESEQVSAAPENDVLRLLELALASIRSSQHHNPAEFLVDEAIRWTKMSISSWYLEASGDPIVSNFISKLMRRASVGTGK